MLGNAFKALLVGIMLVATASPVFSAGPYIGFAGGVSFLHDSNIDPLRCINLNAGYNFDRFRLEGEFGHRSNSNGDVTIMSYMANGFFDFKNSSDFTPFIGAGLGAINGELDNNAFHFEDTVFAYQLIAGIGLKLNQFNIDLSYRFTGVPESPNKNWDDLLYMSSNIYAGVRFNF